MKYEDKKKVLELYHDIVIDIMILNNECNELREDMLPGSVRISDMPKAHNTSDPMAQFAARLDFLERREKFLIKCMRMIRTSIDALPGSDSRYALTMYYCAEGHTWQEIARTLKTSERSIRRKAHRAIAMIKFQERTARGLLNIYERHREPQEEPESTSGDKVIG